MIHHSCQITLLIVQADFIEIILVAFLIQLLLVDITLEIEMYYSILSGRNNFTCLPVPYLSQIQVVEVIIIS